MSGRKYEVRHHVGRLHGADVDSAWHSLVELGVSALPDVVDAFSQSANTTSRRMLVSVVNEYRTVDAVPFLARCLGDSDPETRKLALDGLVTIGSNSARHAIVLERMKGETLELERLDEALHQIDEAARDRQP